jgi:hypothetical protein
MSLGDIALFASISQVILAGVIGVVTGISPGSNGERIKINFDYALRVQTNNPVNVTFPRSTNFIGGIDS